MRLSAEVVSSIAEGSGFAKAPVGRMPRLFDVLGKLAGDDAGDPAGLAGSLLE